MQSPPVFELGSEAGSSHGALGLELRGCQNGTGKGGLMSVKKLNHLSHRLNQLLL